MLRMLKQRYLGKHAEVKVTEEYRINFHQSNLTCNNIKQSSSLHLDDKQLTLSRVSHGANEMGDDDTKMLDIFGFSLSKKSENNLKNQQGQQHFLLGLLGRFYF